MKSRKTSLRSRPSGAVVLVSMRFISFTIYTIIDHVSKITCDPYKNFEQWLACADVESFRTQKSRVDFEKMRTFKHYQQNLTKVVYLLGTDSKSSRFKYTVFWSFEICFIEERTFEIVRNGPKCANQNTPDRK